MEEKKPGELYTRILIPAVIVAFVLYLIFSVWIGLRNPYTFTAAYTDTMESSALAQGWVVRSEIPVASGEGLVQRNREENERVAKDATIAVVYQDEEYEKHQAELLETGKKLTALQYAIHNESPSGVALENQMRGAMVALPTSASSGNYTDLAQQTETYRKLVLRREYLVSSEGAGAMNQAAGELGAQYRALQSSNSGVTTITAAAAGVFSTQLDGYESLLNPDSLDGISVQGLAELANLTPLDNSGYLGKIITNTTWYYAVAMDGTSAQNFYAGKQVQVYFDALATTLTMTVASVGETVDDQALVLLRSSQNAEEAAGLRQESCRVVFRTNEGIRVSKKALYINEEGETGVYVAVGYTARFRPVRILAEDDDFYLVRAAPKDVDDKRVLKTGDDVIVSSVELYNGKVVR